MTRFRYPLNIGLTSDWTGGGEAIADERLVFAIDGLLARNRGSGLDLQINFLVAVCSGQDVKTARLLSQKYPEAVLHLLLPVQQDNMAEVLSTEAMSEFNAVVKIAGNVSQGGQAGPDGLASGYWSQFLERARRSAGRFLINHCDYVVFSHTTGQNKGPGYEYLLDIAKNKQCPGLVLSGGGGVQELRGETMARSFMAAMSRFEGFMEQGPVSKHYLSDELKGGLGNDMPSDTLAALERHFLPVFAAAESQAAKFQNVYNRAGVWAFACSFFAAALVAVAVTFFYSAPFFFALEFVMLMTGLGLIFRAENKKSRRNWQSLRHLAEQLRTFFYLTVVGVERPQAYVSRRVNPGRESGWASMVMHQIANATPLPQWQDNKLDSLVEFIRDKWLEGQVDYHDDKLNGTREKAEHLERASKFLFVLATLFALAHAVVPMAWQAFHGHLAAHWLTLFALILPVAGGVLGATLSHRDYKRIALHSEKMIHDLERFREGFAPLTMEELQNNALELADIMLGESEQWVGHISARSLHPEP